MGRGEGGGGFDEEEEEEEEEERKIGILDASPLVAGTLFEI